MDSEETAETGPESLSDRELLVRTYKILRHLDPMVHEVHGWAARAAPLLERFGGFKAAVGKAARRGR
jgi:hypothetical protein